MNTHTRGPWEVRPLHHVDSETLIAPCDLNKAPVGTAYTYAGGCRGAIEEGKSNARIMAAAPELLEAARVGLAFLKSEYPLDHGSRKVGEAWGALEAAIAKAEGGEP